MPRDDKEKHIPARVKQAVESARAAARADRERKAGRWLAALPVAVAALLLFLMMPRATAPDAVPLPRVDERVLVRIARADDARAATAEQERLPTDVLAVGGALREFNAVEARGGDEVERIDARRRIDGAVRDLARRTGIEDDLLALRAVQLRHFLDALARWERSGEESEELTRLSGAFLDRARDAGWVADGRVLLTEAQRRVAFKAVWNALVSVESNPRFALGLDEQRALYVLYIEHPHPPDSSRAGLVSQRRSATTKEACASANAEERRQTELWRADKIRRLGGIDPDYPTSYALGVAYYRAGRYDLSAEAFTAFMSEHPSGPYALRAQNHLKAALVAAGSL